MRWRRERDSTWWRVQAFWTVDGERRNYWPVFCEGRDLAKQTATEMAETLSHFPTLEVVVTPSNADEAQAAELEREAAIANHEKQPLHLMLDPARQVTACGIDTETNWATPDTWNWSSAPKCAECDAIATNVS